MSEEKAGEVWKEVETGVLYHVMVVDKEENWNYGYIEMDGFRGFFSHEHIGFTDGKVCLGMSEKLFKRERKHTDGSDYYILRMSLMERLKLLVYGHDVNNCVKL